VRLKLDYGSDGLTVDLPGERTTVIEPVPVPAVADPLETLLTFNYTPPERKRWRAQGRCYQSRRADLAKPNAKAT
jgi:hypothetical protein